MDIIRTYILARHHQDKDIPSKVGYMGNRFHIQRAR